MSSFYCVYAYGMCFSFWKWHLSVIFEEFPWTSAWSTPFRSSLWGGRSTFSGAKSVSLMFPRCGWTRIWSSWLILLNLYLAGSRKRWQCSSFGLLECVIWIWSSPDSPFALIFPVLCIFRVFRESLGSEMTALRGDFFLGSLNFPHSSCMIWIRIWEA